MKRNTRPPKRKSLVQAIKEVTAKTGSSRRPLTKRERIIDACGTDLYLLVEMMCDKRYTGSYIHRVLTAMGIKVSYPYVQQQLRPWFRDNYQWFAEVVERNVDEETKYPASLTDEHAGS